MTNDCGELLPDPIPDHPLLNGRVEIGRGENTIVLDGDVVDGQARQRRNAPPARRRPARHQAAGLSCSRHARES